MDGPPEIRWIPRGVHVLPTDLGGPKPRREFRVWHMAVLVLASALILGGLVTLRDEANGSPLASWRLISAVVATFAITAFATARVASRLLRGPLHRLGFWGVLRGGLAGFVAWLLASAAEAAILFGSIAFGLAVALGLAWFVLGR